MHDRVDVADLEHSLAAVLEAVAWSQPSSLALNGVHDGYRRITLAVAGKRMRAAAPFGELLDSFAPVREAWLSALDPGGFILPHRDAGPWLERWHVPIIASGTFATDGDVYTPEPGVPFRVEHWRCHELVNAGDRQRVHLVMDRAVSVDRPHATFALCQEA